MSFEKGVSKPCHASCYKSKTGRDASPRSSKFRSICVLCKATIYQGDAIAFMRTRLAGSGSNAAAVEIVEEEPDTSPEGNKTPAVESNTSTGNTTAPAANAASAADGVAGAIAAVLLPLVAADVDKKIAAKLGAVDVDSIVAEATAAIDEKIAAISMPREIVVTQVDGSSANVGVQHKQFETLLKAVAARCNVWLAGPSGSGKSTAAINVSKALGKEFYFTGAVGDQYALIGYNDANGKYVRTPFREAWEHGGIFLWDEVDGSDPNALVAFNAALANDVMAFPDKVLPRNPECYIIAAANTWGHGATHEYVGRMKLDQAFLKRFVCLAWDYDNELEMATAPNAAWTWRVQAVRAAVKAKGLRVLVTPRESYFGARLLAAGLSQEVVERMTLQSGMTEEQWKSLASCL